MTNYIENVKKNVAGQGIVYQVGNSLPPPPSQLPDMGSLQISTSPRPTSGSRSYYSTTSPRPYTGPPVGSAGSSPPSSPSPPPAVSPKMENGFSLKRPSQFVGSPSPSNNPPGPRSHHIPVAANVKPSPLLLTTASSILAVHAWKCRGCDQVMSPGEVAIFAERAGDDNCWHPSCFNCSR